MAQAARALAEFELPKTKAGKPNANWTKAMREMLEALAAKQWTSILEKGFVKSILAGNAAYSRVEIEPELRDLVAPVVLAARAELLDGLIEQTHGTKELLALFETEYENLKHQRGCYQFSDLPASLAPPGREQSAFVERDLDLWFRLDGRLNHLLLDEFQDTAPDQWRVLEPLADEILADGTGERSFFCVGDIKQSIYGFRQAEPRLLAGLDRRYPGLEAEPMLRSYRSSSVVLDTVNAVFCGVGSNRVFEGDERVPHREAAHAFERDFGAHQAARDIRGVTRVLQCRDKSETESGFEPAILEMVVERTRAIAREAPRASIGILLRKGKWIPALIHALRCAGIVASGEGGNPLTDSEGVLSILSLLLLADHPVDSAAAFHVETSDLGPIAGLLTGHDQAGRSRLAADIRRRLMVEGYGPVVAGWCDALIASDASEWDRLRLTQLIDLAYAWEERAGLRPHDFVLYVRNEKIATPVAARVRVMTIHKSKGLEFDAVLLPDVGEAVKIAPEDVLSRRPDPYGPIDAVSAYNRKSDLMISDELAQLYADEQRRNVTEMLCVLYVAMTRAARCLEMIVRPPSTSASSGPTLNFQGIVLDALSPGAREDSGILWVHPESHPDWGGDLSEEDVPVQEALPVDFALAPTRSRRAMPRRSPSSGQAPRPLAYALASSRPAAVGTLVHEMLEAIEWLDDAKADTFSEEYQRSLVRSGQDAALVQEAAGLACSAMRADEIVACLTRPSIDAGNELRVHAEYTYQQTVMDPAQEEAGGQEQLWSGSIDRLVLEMKGGRAVHAWVIDYKTDDVDSEGIRSAAEHHRPQLEAYGGLIATEFSLDADQIELQLMFLRPGRVVTL
ncbi:MAG: ATP-dependent helicase/nuclease subunit A [Planctomycetota bacterium]